MPMARQLTGFITGTYDDLTFYKMEEQFYVRMKSSLTGKRFWQERCFEGSRQSADRFGKGNNLASKVYQSIDAEKRVYNLFCFFKRRAIAMLKAGRSLEATEGILREYAIEFGFLDRRAEPNATSDVPVPGAAKTASRPAEKRDINKKLVQEPAGPGEARRRNRSRVT